MKSKSLIFVLFSTLILVWVGVLTYPQEKLKVVFCNVGQGDATLAIFGSTQVLIDGGAGSKVLSCLSKNMPFWDKTIEMVILTHPDYDHMAGILPVLERYHLKQFVANGLLVDKEIFWQIRKQINQKNIPVFVPESGDELKVGKLSFKVIWPAERKGEALSWTESLDKNILGAQVFSGETNDFSIVSKLSYGNFDLLLTGDLPMEEEIMIKEKVGDIEVLKVAHHGSKFSTSGAFLEAITPQLSVISVGNNNYGHPSAEVMERLKNLGIQVKRTDWDGEVVVVSDGQNWSVLAD